MAEVPVHEMRLAQDLFDQRLRLPWAHTQEFAVRRNMAFELFHDKYRAAEGFSKAAPSLAVVHIMLQFEAVAVLKGLVELSGFVDIGGQTCPVARHCH